MLFRNYLFLLFLLFFVSLFSFSSFAVLSSNSAVLNVSLDLPISFVAQRGASFEYLDVEFTLVPVDDVRQRTLSSSFSVVPFDSGVGVVNFRLNSFDDVVIGSNFVVKSVAKVNFVREKVSFPLSELDPSLSRYLSESDVFDLTPQMRSLAVDLARGEDDLFMVVVKIADWVNEEVSYDLGTLSSDSLSASWVFSNRVGVCTEFTSLFISLVRSLGIPAREVSGIAFSNSELFPLGWGFHSWAEVYFPHTGWVPFDPTYKQFGFVDSGHIKLGVGESGESQKNSFSWRARGVDVFPEETVLGVDVLEKEGSNAFDNVLVSTSLFEEEAGPNSFNFLKITLSNNNDFYLASTIRFAGVDGLSFISPRVRTVALAPFESRDVYVVFKISKELDERFVYSFPLRFSFNGESYSDLLKAHVGASFISEGDVSIFLDDSIVFGNAFFCEYDSVLKLHDYLFVDCGLALDSGYLCFEDCYFFNKGDALKFNVSFNDPGLFVRRVSFESGSVSDVSFLKVLVLDDPFFEFSVAHSSSLSSDEVGFLNVSLFKNSSSIPRNVSLIINHDYFVESFSLGDVSDSFLFSFSFPVNNLKRSNNELLVEVVFFDDLGNSFSQEFVVDVFVSNLDIFDEVSFFFRKIYYWVRSLVV